MRPDDLRAFLLRKPFRPFRLRILETTSFELRHPELVQLGPTTITIHVPAVGPPSPVGARLVTVALLHISSLELLPVPGSSGNGQVG
jgi:hypothetical protein